MKFPFAPLYAAVCSQIAPEVGARLILGSGVLMHGRDLLSEDDAGELLAACIMPGDPLQIAATIENLSLTAVMIEACGERVVIDADDASRHPLVARWLPLSFASALAAPIRSGLQMYLLTGDAPAYIGAEVCEAGGTIRNASLTYAINGAQCVLQYGPSIPDATYVTRHAISGNALFMVGEQLRVGPSSDDDPPEPPTPDGPPWTERVVH